MTATTTSTSNHASTPGAPPVDPRGAVSLPPDSPAASIPTKTTDGALATAPSAVVDTKKWTVKSIVLVTLVVLWLLFGLIGFVMSLVCFGYSGSIGEKILGIVIALVLGPWYFLYYFSSGSYCKAMPPTLF